MQFEKNTITNNNQFQNDSQYSQVRNNFDLPLPNNSNFVEDYRYQNNFNEYNYNNSNYQQQTINSNQMGLRPNLSQRVPIQSILFAKIVNNIKNFSQYQFNPNQQQFFNQRKGYNFILL